MREDTERPEGVLAAPAVWWERVQRKSFQSFPCYMMMKKSIYGAATLPIRMVMELPASKLPISARVSLKQVKGQDK